MHLKRHITPYDFVGLYKICQHIVKIACLLIHQKKTGSDIF